MKQKIQWLLLVVMVLLVAGCGVLSGSVTTGADTEFRTDGQVFTYCGAVCAAKGQCGQIDRNGTTVSVVLVNPSEPATENHGAFIEDNFAVNVLELRRIDVIFEATGTPFEGYPFYRVGDTSSPIVGWVDGVCLADKAR